MWTIYPVEEPEDVDTFDSQQDAMNAADRLANASSRDYKVTDGSRSFSVEPESYDE